MLIVVATAAVALHSSIPYGLGNFSVLAIGSAWPFITLAAKFVPQTFPKPQTLNPKPQTPKPAKVLLKPLSHQTLEPCCRKLVLSLSWGVGGRGVRNYISLNRPYEVLVIGIKAPYLNRPY